MTIINDNIISLQELISQLGGEDGVQGIQGVQGIPGLQGLQGPRGAQGQQGYRGIQGAQGAQGLKGHTGLQGLQGPRGVQGQQGYTGITGAQGPKGSPGLQGPMGAQGASGLQGILGCQGVQGVQGTAGVQGARGYKGTAGLQGILGCQGVQGVQGTAGVQGARGYKGTAGIQGPTGLQGIQGTQGINGMQGFQGYRGVQGQQGYKGVIGPQGPTGPQGSSGLQGTMGCQGLQGPKGLVGIQGVQGPKGSKGPRGYMGYQGDSGDAGIQGLQGEAGTVWFDGIRLNGYNTKLYTFDQNLGYFVSANDQNEHNYLKVKNGAVIKVVFDENSAAALRAGTIPVKSLEYSQNSLTNYPAYYSENVPISNVLTSRIPNRTVMEFTYYDNGWYYSGGSLVSSSSTDAALTANIKVKGVTVGNINNGETLEAGTTMQEIFEHMLVKVTPAKATAPKPVPQSPTGSSVPHNNGTVEVGDTVSFTMSTRYDDGYYSSSNTSLYPVSEFNHINGCTDGKLPAECELVSKTYYRNGSVTSPTVSYASVPEGNYTYLCSVTYRASSVVPKNSDGGANTGIVIQAGTSPQVTNFSFRARYKLYYGYTPADPSNSYADRFTTAAQLQTLGFGWLAESGASEPMSMDSLEGRTAFVIAIPSAYRVTATSTVNGIPVNVDEKWVYRNSVQYVNGSVETTYRVYVMHALIPQTYTNITVTKQ